MIRKKAKAAVVPTVDPADADAAVTAFCDALRKARPDAVARATDAVEHLAKVKTADEAATKAVEDRFHVGEWLSSTVAAELGRTPDWLENGFEPTFTELAQAQQQTAKDLANAGLTVTRTAGIVAEIDAALQANGPKITDVSPKRRTRRSGLAVTLTVERLEPGTVKAAMFGDLKVSDGFAEGASGELTVEHMPDYSAITKETTVSVSLLDGEGKVLATKADAFTFVPDPVLASLDPSTGPSDATTTVALHYQSWNNTEVPDTSCVVAVLFGEQALLPKDGDRTVVGLESIISVAVPPTGAKGPVTVTSNRADAKPALEPVERGFIYT